MKSELTSLLHAILRLSKQPISITYKFKTRKNYMTTAELITNNEIQQAALMAVEREERLFELAQRKANVYAKSSLVPKEYQNNIGNVLIAENMAKRMGADTLMVMQNLYIVYNRPGWSAQFLIATFNTCGRFSAIKYKFSGTPGADDWGCVAFAKEHDTGEVIEGTRVTIKMSKDEGWYQKSGSKWKTMPEQMMRYRAATFLIRSTAPEIGMGLLTREELEDTHEPSRAIPVNSVEQIAKLLDANSTHPTPGDEPAQLTPDNSEELPSEEPNHSETPNSSDGGWLAEFAAAQTLVELTGIYGKYEAGNPELQQDPDFNIVYEENKRRIKSGNGGAK
jgi:hypothetical protein